MVELAEPSGSVAQETAPAAPSGETEAGASGPNWESLASSLHGVDPDLALEKLGYKSHVDRKAQSLKDKDMAKWRVEQEARVQSEAVAKFMETADEEDIGKWAKTQHLTQKKASEAKDEVFKDYIESVKDLGVPLDDLFESAREHRDFKRFNREVVERIKKVAQEEGEQSAAGRLPTMIKAELASQTGQRFSKENSPDLGKGGVTESDEEFKHRFAAGESQDFERAIKLGLRA